jgi:transposase
MAFLKKSRRKKNGVVYESWALVESYRTPRGPRQRTIATLGKGPGLDEEERVGWEEIIDQLSDGSGKRGHQRDFLQKKRPDTPEWARVDLSRVRVERLRRFGDVLVALSLWKRLELGDFFRTTIEEGREEIPWWMLLCVHAVARFCEPSSDLAIAESFVPRTALGDVLGISEEKIYDNRLYRTLDKVNSCRDALFTHLKGRYGDLFGATFDILLYDITSTYFEGQAEQNEKAARGYSRDSRPDCKQVCLGLVVTPEQLPLAYEVFAGNRADVTTVEDIFDKMEKTYGDARRVWVLDRGMVSEENLALLRRRGAAYIVGTPRSMLKKCEQALLNPNWEEVEPGIEVQCVTLPPGEDENGEPDPGAEERFLLCRSRQRVEKDKAIVAKAAERLEKELMKLKAGIDTGRVRSRQRAERRVGRLLEKYTRAARLFHVSIKEGKDPGNPKKTRLYITITKNEELDTWLGLQNGCYLLRTNVTDVSAAELWRTYIGLTEVESAFRQLKNPLQMRPVYHQHEHRVDAHIFIAFLALCMRRTLSLWMEGCGLGSAPQKLIDELRHIHSMDVVLRTKEDTELRLRVVGTPEEKTRVLLHHLGLKIPNRPKKIENVVATFTLKKT